MTNTTNPPSATDEQRALALYKPPFRYEHGYIYDADNHIVADDPAGPPAALRVRGWGRITYMERPEQLQDAVGELVAKALTAYWTRDDELLHLRELLKQKDAELVRFKEAKPVAWLSIDCIGERYLCFTKPNDGAEARPLFAAPQPDGEGKA